MMVKQVVMLKQVMRCRGMVCCGFPCGVSVGDTEIFVMKQVELLVPLIFF